MDLQTMVVNGTKKVSEEELKARIAELESDVEHYKGVIQLLNDKFSVINVDLPRFGNGKP